MDPRRDMCAVPEISEHSKVTVGIVTFNSSDHIVACLESVAEKLSDASPTVFVLDNASTDDTVSKVKSIRKKYKYALNLLTETRNHGYAYGVNRIAELARTDWLCLINPDAELLTEPFEAARIMSKKVPTCGVLGGIITDNDGNPQECGGVFPSPLMAVWDWCGLRHILPLKNWSTTLKWDLKEDESAARIDYPTGAFWIFRREVYQRVGPFDERFFLYFEETDFCRRAKEKGWPSFIIPSVRIRHARGASIQSLTNGRSTPMDPLAIYFESLFKYLDKHFAPWRVNMAVSMINSFLKARTWLRKDDKSTLILETFTKGLQKAREYVVEKMEAEKKVPG